MLSEASFTPVEQLQEHIDARLALKNGKPSLHLIEPRRPGRGEMEMDVWVFLEPALTLFMGVETVHIMPISA
jgi:hypothetical protein